MAHPKRKFTLYWSNLETYEKCPQLFLWQRGWGDLDVGGGPGRPKPKPEKESRHHAVMGIVIQKVIEDLYNKELWRNPQGLPERLQAMIEHEFNYEISRNYIDWQKAPSKFELLQICRDGVAGFLRTMKAERLLGPYARAEVELMGYVNADTPIGGRADLIVRRDDVGTMILDGKNSKEKGRYTSPDQLRWYALCHYLAFGTMPDKLGFVYYRYPAGTPKEDGTQETGVDWVPFTREDVEGIAARAAEARRLMEQQQFAPTPSPKGCEWCAYITVCEARQNQKAANAARRNKNKDSSSPKTEIVLGEDGYAEIEF